jgi:UDP:flavonoid glycosyltransferase YjiC (YdhE family)
MKGERVVFLEDFEFNNKIYKKGHQFKIVGEDSMRGYDLEDDNGNRISETRFISDKYELISKLREDKLKELGL